MTEFSNAQLQAERGIPQPDEPLDDDANPVWRSGPEYGSYTSPNWLGSYPHYTSGQSFSNGYPRSNMFSSAITQPTDKQPWNTKYVDDKHPVSFLASPDKLYGTGALSLEAPTGKFATLPIKPRLWGAYVPERNFTKPMPYGVTQAPVKMGPKFSIGGKKIKRKGRRV